MLVFVPVHITNWYFWFHPQSLIWNYVINVSKIIDTDFV